MKILWQDTLIILALIFHWGALFTTNYIIGTIQQVSSVATEVAAQVEKDPFARTALDFRYGIEIITVVSQALLITCWIYARSMMLKKKINPFYVNWFALSVFISFSTDFFNNLPIFLRFFGVA